MKRLLISIVLASAMFAAVAMATSAKFTAVYNLEDPSGLKPVKHDTRTNLI